VLPGSLLQTQTADDLTLTVSVEPGRAGQNRMDFYLQDNDGDERPVQRFIVRLTYLDQRLGTTEDDATAVHPTHFVLEGSQLALPGRWRMDLVVRREGLNDARASFEFEVGPP
jgi:copper transport protein